MPETIYAGLPADLTPPYAAAMRIVDLQTLAERERLIASIPEQWRALISHFARIGLATDIVVAPSRDGRQRRLAEVPPAWRSDIEAHALRLWPRREELRADTWRPGRRPEESAA